MHWIHLCRRADTRKIKLQKIIIWPNENLKKFCFYFAGLLKYRGTFQRPETRDMATYFTIAIDIIDMLTAKLGHSFQNEAKTIGSQPITTTN